MMKYCTVRGGGNTTKAHAHENMVMRLTFAIDSIISVAETPHFIT